MSVQVICDHCQKPMDIRGFNESQTTVRIFYRICTSNDTNAVDQDVCPHCAIAILTQLVQTWGG